MDLVQDIANDGKDQMEKTIEALKKQLASIRTGRANPGMLDGVRVDYYGTPTPINQLATISVLDARMLFIKPFQKGVSKDIERAIVESNIGLTPSSDGDNVRVPVPSLTQERRRDYVRQSKDKCEDAKVAIRAARRDSNELLKESVKDKSISEDDEKRGLKLVQDFTDAYVKRIDELLVKKEAEIMEI